MRVSTEQINETNDVTVHATRFEIEFTYEYGYD